MLEIITILSVLAAIALLVALSAIDLKEGILPNEMVLGLAATGLVFHTSQMFAHMEMVDMGLGIFIGGGILYVIRSVSNYFHQDDTLGLGDVKLMAAGGVWLGAEGILFALSLGALAGFVHGAIVAIIAMRKAGVRVSITKFSIPAGPGFAAGLFLTALYLYTPLKDLFPL